ncbi:hypothetical protein P2318_27670 [Myxococcaceae bacterium GXIMD 01537]
MVDESAIDVAARRRAAELLRGFAEGRLSNVELDARYPGRSGDPAVHAVYARTWRYQDDYREYRLTGDLAPSEEELCLLRRCALFLETSLPYEWPSLARRALRAVSARIPRRGAPTISEERGDLAAWPFFRREDLAAAERQAPAHD